MRGSTVRDGRQTSAQILQHTLQIAHDVIVPVSNDLIASGLQTGRSIGIGWAVGVLTAVGFDDDPHFLTKKVSDTSRHRRLSAKFEAEKLTRAQCMPQLLLGIGFVAPQFAGHAR